MTQNVKNMNAVKIIILFHNEVLLSEQSKNHFKLKIKSD
jgi:hypothetical protein